MGGWNGEGPKVFYVFTRYKSTAQTEMVYLSKNNCKTDNVVWNRVLDCKQLIQIN